MFMDDDAVIVTESLKKRYRIGMINTGTLRHDLESFFAKVRGQSDPNTKIGAQGKWEKGEIYAIDGIDLKVNKGQKVGIIGGNGSGKSTFLRLLSHITIPTEGKIYIKGKIASMLEVGTGFHPELSGRENIYLNGAILGMKKYEVDQKIEDIIEFSECRDFIETPVKRYSSGMYVKLGFAVTAQLASDILLMDEVLAVGDVGFQQKCIAKMNELAFDKGRTILYVSHNMKTVRDLCNRVVVFSHGHIVFDGGVENGIEVYENIQKVPLSRSDSR